MLSIPQIVLNVIVDYSVIFGGEYLYRFVWKRRTLRRGDVLEKRRYTIALRRFVKDRILLVFGVFVLLGFVEMSVHSQQVTTWLLNLMEKRIAQATTGMLVLILGLTGSWIRRKHRVGYGLTEIGFGFVGGIIAAEQITSADKIFPALSALIACVYVVVRGYTNIEEA